MYRFFNQFCFQPLSPASSPLQELLLPLILDPLWASEAQVSLLWVFYAVGLNFSFLWFFQVSTYSYAFQLPKIYPHSLVFHSLHLLWFMLFLVHCKPSRIGREQKVNRCPIYHTCLKSSFLLNCKIFAIGLKNNQ